MQIPLRSFLVQLPLAPKTQSSFRQRITRVACGWTLAVLATAGLAAAELQTTKDGSTSAVAQTSGAQTARATILTGSVTNAPSDGLVLVVNRERRTVKFEDDGVKFSVALELPEPSYVDLELPREKTLTLYLKPGQALSVTCDASDPYKTARFTGGAAVENAGFALLQVYYDRIDYNRLFSSSPQAFLGELRGHQQALENDLLDYARSHPNLDPEFLRLEKARIVYLAALLRLSRLGLSPDWNAYASKLNLDDPSLLRVSTYSRLLNRYVKAKAEGRLRADPGLQVSINQQTDARYAVALETFRNPRVRSAQLYEIMLNQFSEGDDGPYGCKGIADTMARFDRDCTDELLRKDIDNRYRQCLSNRNAPEIRVYRTVGKVTLDAHVFPAAGAKTGEKRPAFLFFHGGGWAAGMPEWGYARCRHYSELGLVGISFEYRLHWRHGTTPLESMADAWAAVRWVRRNAGELGIDPDRIVVAGFSAGGHLAAVTGLISENAVPAVPPGDSPAEREVSTTPNAMVLMSAAVDVAGDGWFRRLLAGRGDEVKASPAQQVRRGLPPAIVFHGLDDPLCPFAKTETFCRNLRDAGNRCELHTFKGGHFRAGNEWAEIHAKIDAFLGSLGFIPTGRATK